MLLSDCSHVRHVHVSGTSQILYIRIGNCRYTMMSNANAPHLTTEPGDTLDALSIDLNDW